MNILPGGVQDPVCDTATAVIQRPQITTPSGHRSSHREPVCLRTVEQRRYQASSILPMLLQLYVPCSQGNR